MTPEDFAISLALCRFMGWREAQDIRAQFSSSWDGATTYATFGAPSTIVISAPTRLVPYEWKPLERAEQAAEVMAEAALRGIPVRTVAFPAMTELERPTNEPAPRDRNWFAAKASGPAIIASTGTWADLGEKFVPGPLTDRASIIAAWSRAVCLAVLGAVENAASLR